MNKHTVTLPDGTTATRNSKSRVYPFCVAVRSSYEHDLAQAKAPSRVWMDNFKFYQQELNPDTRKYWHTPEELERMAQAVAHGSPEAYRDHQGALDVARVEAARAHGHYDKWGVLGWNGRLDLAQKLAAGEGAHARFAECRILETNFAS